MLESCEELEYEVQENDTLESIANHFSISKEEIMSINNMKTETVNAKMELMIPICNFTPTGTVNPTALTTTYTPSTSPVPSTPGG
jgi:LysM repeat protein